MKHIIKHNNSYLYAEDITIFRIQLIILISISVYFTIKVDSLFILIPIITFLIISTYLIASFLPTVVLSKKSLKYKYTFLPFFYKKLQLDSLRKISIKGKNETKIYAQADSAGQLIYSKDIEVYAFDSNNKIKLLFIEDIGGESSISKKVIRDRKIL